MSSEILYIVGGRSFSSRNHGRKIHEVISVWKRLGIEVNVVFGKDINVVDDNSENYGNQKYHNNILRKKAYLQFFINSISELKDIIHNRKLNKKIKQDYLNSNLDLVWERSSRLHWSGIKIAKLKKIPFVLEWKDHLIDYNFSFFKWYANYIERKKINLANYIVVESYVLKEVLIRQGVPINKIRVALNSVNPKEFKRNNIEGSKIRKELKINKNTIIVGYLGSYAFYHNTVFLIEAAKIILERTTGISFLLVGNGQDYYKCKMLAEKYKLFDKGLIMLEGVPKEKVPQILSSMDITILPGSTDIICPIKIMEYMAAKTAVIAPDYLCNREVIDDGINGILFDPNSINDLVNKIKMLKEDSQKIEYLSINARDYVSRELIWEQTWGKTLIDILANEKSN